MCDKIILSQLLARSEIHRMNNAKQIKDNLDEALCEAKKIISEIKYGSVTLIVQDGVVIQIERQEKIRLK